MMSERPEVLFGFNRKGDPVMIPLHMTGISGINESGKTQVAMTLAKRFAEGGVKVLILDVKGIQRDYEDFGDAEIPIYISRATAPETLQRLLAQTAKGDQQFSHEFDSILLAYQKCPEDDRTPGRMQKILEGWVAAYDAWQEKSSRGEKAGRYPRHPLDAKADRKVLYFLTQLNEQLDKIRPVDYLRLPGKINVMDLHGLDREYQQLPVESLFSFLGKNVREVAPEFLFIIMDEAKRFIPQSSKAGAKQIVIQAAKEFRAGGAFLCMIDQTISGVHIEARRQVWNWIMGRQGETVESERVFKEVPDELRNVPGAPVKPSMVKQLDTGWFILWTRLGVDVVFHAPYWAPPEEARRVALGQLTPKGLWNKYHSRVSGEDEEVWKEKYEELKRQHNDWVETQVEAQKRVVELEEGYATLQKTAQEQVDRIDQLNKDNEALKKTGLDLVDRAEKLRKEAEFGEKFVALLKEVLPQAPSGPGDLAKGEVSLTHTQWEVKTRQEIRHVDVDTTTVKGKLLRLAADGFFDTPKQLGAVEECFNRKGWNATRQELAQTLVELRKQELLGGTQQSNKQWVYFKSEDVVYQK